MINLNLQFFFRKNANFREEFLDSERNEECFYNDV